jgi:hypothetical protein
VFLLDVRSFKLLSVLPDPEAGAARIATACSCSTCVLSSFDVCSIKLLSVLPDPEARAARIATACSCSTCVLSSFCLFCWTPRGGRRSDCHRVFLLDVRSFKLLSVLPDPARGGRRSDCHRVFLLDVRSIKPLSVLPDPEAGDLALDYGLLLYM